MAERSKIEWTYGTFNPWRGCTKVSPGCENCYAETLSRRNPATLGEWGPKGKRAIAAESYWRQPIRWNAEAEKEGRRRRIFCASLADVFEDNTQVEEARKRLFRLIEETPWLDWLLLTKRPQNIHGMLPWEWEEGDRMPQNIWLGTSVENQKYADIRIPQLLEVRNTYKVTVLFLSCEPLIGPVTLKPFLTPSVNTIDWVIVGGESGSLLDSRPMKKEWVRDLRDECRKYGIPFFFKQWGSFDEHGQAIGKKLSGNILDETRYHELPMVWTYDKDEGGGD